MRHRRMCLDELLALARRRIAELKALEEQHYAERRAGELLRETAKTEQRQTQRKGGSTVSSRHDTVPPTLADLGLTRDQSGRPPARRTTVATTAGRHGASNVIALAAWRRRRRPARGR